MSAWGIVAAAGRGERLEDAGGVPKAMLPVAGTEMFLRALELFDAADGIDGSVLVIPPLWNDHVLERVLGRFKRPVEITNGGATRGASVRAALGLLGDDVDAVVVHDAARPLATPDLVARALDGLAGADGAVCAVPLADTLKRADAGRVTETVEREGLWRVQTPQAFRLEALRRAHDEALRDGFEGTDDAALVERAGGSVVVVPGDERNINVTTRADLAVAEALLAREEGDG